MVPGAFTTVTPCRAASPDRGCTNPAYPAGSASAIPVGTRARSPGASSTSTAVTRSAPASPGWAYAGSGRSGSRRCTSTSSSLSGTAPKATFPDRAPGGPGHRLTAVADPAEYDERLTVPWWWWLVGAGIAGILAVEVHLAAPDLPVPAAYALTAALVAAALFALGRVRITVAAGQLRVADARLPLRFVAEVAPLDPAGKRTLLGPKGDPADPTPYWLVSTRRPVALAAALQAARARSS